MHDLTGFGAGSGRLHRVASWVIVGIGVLLLLAWLLLALPALATGHVIDWGEWAVSTGLLLGLASFALVLNPLWDRYYRAYGSPTALVVNEEGVTLRYDRRGDVLLPWKDADRWFFLTDQSHCSREDLRGPFPSDYYLNAGRGTTWLTQAAFEEILRAARAAGVEYVSELGKAASVWASGFLRGKVVYYARPTEPGSGGNARPAPAADPPGPPGS